MTRYGEHPKERRRLWSRKRVNFWYFFFKTKNKTFLDFAASNFGEKISKNWSKAHNTKHGSFKRGNLPSEGDRRKNQRLNLNNRLRLDHPWCDAPMATPQRTSIPSNCTSHHSEHEHRGPLYFLFRSHIGNLDGSKGQRDYVGWNVSHSAHRW